MTKAKWTEEHNIDHLAERLADGVIVGKRNGVLSLITEAEGGYCDTVIEIEPLITYLKEHFTEEMADIMEKLYD